MKFKNSIKILFCLIFSVQKTSCTLSVSQYAPDSFFQKPYFDQNNFSNISVNFSGGYATQAFNQENQKVPFLQQFGPEDFLQRFIDHSLDRNNITSLGQGQLSGNFHYRQIIIAAYKNIFHHLFIEGATVIQDLTVNSISAEFIPAETPLTNPQIVYLEKLQSTLPSTINRSGMYTTAFYIGYNKTFNNFKHLDFIDILLKTGFATPQAMLENNNSIVQFPFQGNFNFGYPVIGAVSFGLLDWMTLGINGTVEPYQPAMTNVPMNNSRSTNQILIPETSLAIINRGPLFSTAMYLEADHIISGVSGVAGYTYTKNLKTTIEPINQSKYPIIQANNSILWDSWSLGSFYFEFDVDFAHENHANAPVITFFCAIPIAGELCPKTNIFGGAYNLQLSYTF